MKVLFIVQGEGRGHLTQALTMEKMLRDNGHEVVEMLVGKSRSRSLPDFFLRKAEAPVRQFASPNFLPSRSGKHVGWLSSVAYNVLRSPRYVQSLFFLRRRIRETGADLVVNFYELLCGLAYQLFRPTAPEVCIGHQYLFLHPDFDFPHQNKLSQKLLTLFTRATSLGAQRRLALALRPYEADERQCLTIVPPLIRQEVRNALRHRGDYITGYVLNAGFSEDIIRWHEAHPTTPLHFFWDKPNRKIDDTLTFHALDDELFIRYLANCRAYATTGGFESICEAFYMGKPVMMVPAHTEQECNAHDAEMEGAGIVDHDFLISRLNDFSRRYMEDVDFRMWENHASQHIIAALEAAYDESRHPTTITFRPGDSLVGRLGSALGWTPAPRYALG